MDEKQQVLESTPISDEKRKELIAYMAKVYGVTEEEVAEDCVIVAAGDAPQEQPKAVEPPKGERGWTAMCPCGAVMQFQAKDWKAARHRLMEAGWRTFGKRWHCKYCTAERRARGKH